jgi:acetoacetyl-CoA synthetase
MPSREGNGGGLIMLGRSDGVLCVLEVCSQGVADHLVRRNPGGIRFGSAEIYDVIDTCFSEGTPGLSREMTVVDALCVGQKIGVEKADERVLLFVKLLDGVTLSKELISAISKEVTNRRSRRHVPAKVRGACLCSVGNLFHGADFFFLRCAVHSSG